MVDRRNCQVLLAALIIVVIEKVSIVIRLFGCFANLEGISSLPQAAGNHKDSDSSVSSYFIL